MGLIHISEIFICVKEGVIIINDVIIITYTSLIWKLLMSVVNRQLKSLYK